MGNSGSKVNAGKESKDINISVYNDGKEEEIEEVKPRANFDWKELIPKVKPNERTPLLNLLATNTNIVTDGKEVWESVSSFTDLLSLIPSSDRLAIRSIDGREDMMHDELRRLVIGLDVHQYGVTAGMRVGLACDPGPEAGTSLLCMLCRATTIPINVHFPASEIIKLLKALDIEILFLSRSLEEKLDEIARENDIQLIYIDSDPKKAGLFTLDGKRNPLPDTVRYNGPKDVALLLSTSGTTGKPKRVPYPLQNIICGVGCIVRSWHLSPFDVAINMMPYFHIGGICRNLLSPLLAGGAVVCAPSFTPQSFWESIETRDVTWYYAAPTMHAQIVLHVENLGFVPQNKVRYVANAAGGLPPHLAIQLMNTFQCPILPSYGMTECMPISSPPMSYDLDRPGCSGVSVGPEIGIFNDDLTHQVPIGQNGKINVRGWPLMPGYVINEDNQKLGIDENGWFDTGDLGRLDDDGYLYITGRAKAVINRGGEIIAPLEVEDEIKQHDKVRTAMAFSFPHHDLQECVASVIITEGPTRISLPELYKFLKATLEPSKWPQVLVFMEGLPLNHSSKPQRIKLAKRLGVKMLDERNTDPADPIYYEAITPEQGSSLNSPIQCNPIILNEEVVEKAIMDTDLVYGCVVKKKGISWHCYALQKAGSEAECLAKMEQMMHGYLVPSDLTYVKDLTNIEEDNSLRAQVRDMAAAICQNNEIHDDQNLFEQGLTSLKAGNLAAQISKRFECVVQMQDIYTLQTIDKILEILEEKMSTNYPPRPMLQDAPGREFEPKIAPDADKQERAQSNPCVMLLQLFPLIFSGPIRRFIIFCGFWGIRIIMNNEFDINGYSHKALFTFVCAVLVVMLCLAIFMPLVGVLFKWIMIGRYKQGQYPLWGCYYMRWWLTKHFLRFCTKGIYTSTSGLHSFYMRLMGAKIGKNVRIHSSVAIGEYDLIEIGDDTAIDSDAYIRPFHLEGGAMVLDPIVMGEDVSIGYRSIVEPGSVLPPGYTIGMNSSSYDNSRIDARRFNRMLWDGPTMGSKLLMAIPIYLVKGIARFSILFPIVMLLKKLKDPTTISQAIERCATWSVIQWYIVLHIWNVAVIPILYIILVILVKWCIIGKFKKGKKDNWGRLQYWAMSKLLPREEFYHLNHIWGTHFFINNWVYRALGAKVGDRIYWPGSGIDFVEWDLLTIEDDTVFGSRSAVFCSSNDHFSEVVIEKLSMVGDRCVILPGVRLGAHALLASGTFAQENRFYPNFSIAIGQKSGKAITLNKGDEPRLGTQEVRPFGQAVYQSKAAFYVCCPSFFILLHFFSAIFLEIFHYINLPLTAVIVDAYCERDLGWFLLILIATYFIHTLCYILMCQASHTFIIGEYREGYYLWTKSSMLQRREFDHLVRADEFRRITRHLYGSKWLTWYFRAKGAKIGKGTCMYPNGSNPMMTEPNLVTVGDGSVVDYAVLVAHVNTMGKFEVHPVTVGKNCTLKALSRVQSGAKMDDNSALLEHTLLLMGSTLNSNMECQGWPVCRYFERVDQRRVITESNKLEAKEIKMVIEQSF